MVPIAAKYPNWTETRRKSVIEIPFLTRSFTSLNGQRAW